MNLCVVDWEAVFSGLGVIAEVAVASVIFYEFESNRLDRFLEDADKLSEDRRLIYATYCELTEGSIAARSDTFATRIRSDQKLQNACDNNIRLMSRIGARLPHLFRFKRIPIEWHVAAATWIILASYVEGKRNEVGPTFAKHFIPYALASTKGLLKQKRETWVLRDPNGKRDMTFTVQDMKSTREDLKRSLRRNN
jgi:hypothetical protein